MLERQLLQKIAETQLSLGTNALVPLLVGQPTTLIVNRESGAQVELFAEMTETLGGRYREIRVSRSGFVATVSLQSAAETLADRVTGLLEPLRLVEVDAEQGVALLRSESPAVADQARCYYEVLCKTDGSVSLKRWQAEGTMKRQAIAFTLTHDALAKLVNDLGG
jgi:hypothetical protein